MKRNAWLLLAVALCGLSLWAGVRGGGAPPGPDAAPLPPLHVRVLNGTEDPGVARDVGRRLGAAGHVIEGVGNAPRLLPGRTLLVNRRLDDATARRLAAALGGVAVVREWDGRCSEDAVLVLGKDWTTVVAALAPEG